MTEMTARERVWKAINHQEPDRVPIDIGGTIVTGIHVDEYVDLGHYLGLDIGPPKVPEQYQMLARVDALMMRWLNSDVIQVENLVYSWGLRNENWKLWQTNRGNSVLMPGDFNPVMESDGRYHLYDRDGRSIAMMAADGLYFDRDAPTSMSDSITKMDPEKWKRSIPLYGDDELRIMERRARFLHENTDYSLHGGFYKGQLGTPGLFAGHTLPDWLILLATEKDYAYSILQATAERAVENLAMYLQAVGQYIDTIIVSGTDFGTQTGELFNPKTFKELYMPNYKLMNDYVHSHSKAKTMFHSCGSVARIIEYFIEAGVDILNPVQTNTKNMDPARLKQEFGDRIVFWGGGVETQTVLPFGTTDEVRAQVQERIEIFGPGGGFVFSPVHNTQADVPPENVEAMVQAVLEHGRYPIAAQGCYRK